LSAAAGGVGLAQACLDAVTKYAMRILGAYGYSTEYPVARFFRDAPTYAMVEGSANVCKFIIVRKGSDETLF
jgi:glutaryl-CoA dehydrogenase (non-decarboxylating)